MPENRHITIIPQLLDQLSGLTIADSLKLLAGKFPGQVTFSSSFGSEDQVISDHIFSNQIQISVFTLDTGRLFPETYSLWNSTREKYEATIRAYLPDSRLLEPFLEEKGPNAFYESVTNRKTCCHIRKVEPLQRALKGQAVWVTGLRSAHSPERGDLQQVEWDDTNKIIKYHPLFHWTTPQVMEYLHARNVPYNPLHDKGFISIGCAPCTRAVREGENFRAGRWWWEDAEKKECGLHTHST